MYLLASRRALEDARNALGLGGWHMIQLDLDTWTCEKCILVPLCGLEEARLTIPAACIRSVGNEEMLLSSVCPRPYTQLMELHQWTSERRTPCLK